MNKFFAMLVEIENNFSFTKKEDLDWLLDTTLSEEDFSKAYQSFLKIAFQE